MKSAISSNFKGVAMATAVSLKAVMVSMGLTLGAVTIVHAQSTTISDSDIQNYAINMTAAANAKSVSRVSSLIDDDVLISVTRKGRVSTLNKSSYMNLLQLNWSKTSSYNYQMQINNVVVTGGQAKADIRMVELLTENGVTTRLVTDSRATFTKSKSGLVLSRAISQLTIEQH